MDNFQRVSYSVVVALNNHRWVYSSFYFFHYDCRCFCCVFRFHAVLYEFSLFSFHNVSAHKPTVQVNQILMFGVCVPSPNLHENRGLVLIVASCVLLDFFSFCLHVSFASTSRKTKTKATPLDIISFGRFILSLVLLFFLLSFWLSFFQHVFAMGNRINDRFFCLICFWTPTSCWILSICISFTGYIKKSKT